MPPLDKVVRFHMAVSDMGATKDFYTDKLGFTVVNDFAQDGERWVFLALPGDDVSVLFTTEQQFMKPGTMKLYLSTGDVEAARAELIERGVPISGDLNHDRWATWFDFHDPEGNHVLVTG